jgi:chemotaxis protein methyltransferase CheR
VNQAARQLKFVLSEEDDRLSVRDYERLSSLISAKVGIKLPSGKRMMVEGRLRRRVRALGQASFESYCRLIFDRDGLERELPHVIDAITTNKTDFFRESEHYDLLKERLVPDLLAGRRAGSMPLLKIWSAASSNGAEAYSIAMMLADLAAARSDFRFAILGTDISTAMLDQAERAVYPAEMVRPVPRDMQLRYLMFARRPGLRPEVRIVPELRRLTRFARLNLMDKSYPFDRDVDVIFLRNVLIYFEKRDQEAVVARLMGHLRPRGYLILGHSESMIGSNASLNQVAPAVFQKAA